MEEGTSEKHSSPELITPQAIKERVMEFFEGIDLEKSGKTKVGVFSVEKRIYAPIIEHTISVNGLEVARYRHRDPNVTPEPLKAGNYREVAGFRLRGFREGRGDATALLTEYEGRPSEIWIDCPPAAGNRGGSGLIKDLHEDYQRDVAAILEIKI